MGKGKGKGKGRSSASTSASVAGVRRGTWTPQEDMMLIAHIREHGHRNWRVLPTLAGLQRCGKSCRLRWLNYLNPNTKRGNFTKEEEDTIIRLHSLFGNKWSKMASHLCGRTDNEIKNVWNTHLKKRASVSSTLMISNMQPHCDRVIRLEDEVEAPKSDYINLALQSPPLHHYSTNNDVSLTEVPAVSPPPPPEQLSMSMTTELEDLKAKNAWIEYLEKELGLWGGGGGDSVDNYQNQNNIINDTRTSTVVDNYVQSPKTTPITIS